jgi:GTPase SAR1 family protein
VLLVYDITNPKSFEELQEYYKDITQIISKDISYIVVGNKNDLYIQESVPINEAREYAEQINAKYKATSAKTGTGINDMFEELAKTLTAQKNKLAMNESKNKVIETSKLEPTVMVSNKKLNEEKMKGNDTCMC